MRPRSRPFLRLATPAKILLHRWTFAVLLFVSAGLIVLARTDAPALDSSRAWIIDAFAPVLEAMSRPVAAIAALSGEVSELLAMREQNTRLRNENALLLRWQTLATNLQAENRSLRELLNYPPDATKRHVAARVVADVGGVYVRSILVNAGTLDGVTKGRAVVSGEAVIGRVAEVGRRSARVLLMTDLNSRIPVVIQSSRYHAILAGDNSSRPKLLYLPEAAEVLPGDVVVTSSEGAAFPPGLPVGAVASVAGNEVRVRAFADWDRLEYVRILDSSLAAGPLPSKGRDDGARR
ncbi:MAG: rod shape-determining protein MreC [Alphaproteobacteria bacterium]